MTAQRDLTHRHAPTVRESSHVAVDGDVESTSTRVLLDGSDRACDGCEGPIRAGSRYKCLTVRDGDGTVSELCFCDEDCLPLGR